MNRRFVTCRASMGLTKGLYDAGPRQLAEIGLTVTTGLKISGRTSVNA